MKDIYIGETKLNLREALSESIPGVDAVKVEIDSCGLQDWYVTLQSSLQLGRSGFVLISFSIIFGAKLL